MDPTRSLSSFGPAWPQAAPLGDSSPARSWAQRVFQDGPDMLLGQLAEIGATAERYGFGPVGPSAAEPFGTAVDQLDTVAQISEKANRGFILGQIRQNRLQRALGQDHLIRNVDRPAIEYGTTGKVIGWAGKALQATTGVLNVAVAVKRDRESGDISYTQTMKEIVLSTAQTAAGAGAGILVSGAAAGLATAAGSVAIPVALGIGAGLAASYAVGKAFDGIRSWLS